MSSVQPPRLATWLLARLAPGPESESMIGDLEERYRAGRSSLWYWRQVLSVILASVSRDVRGHRLLALRAVAAGWLLHGAFSMPVNWLTRAARIQMEDWLIETGRFTEWGAFWSGQLPATLLVYTACLLTGWLVGRLHARHSMAMVSAFAASLFVLEFAIPLVFLSLGQHRVPLSMLVVLSVLAVGRPIFVLMGGVLAARSVEPRISHV
jgi:hypothetical protein